MCLSCDLRVTWCDLYTGVWCVTVLQCACIGTNSVGADPSFYPESRKYSFYYIACSTLEQQPESLHCMWVTNEHCNQARCACIRLVLCTCTCMHMPLLCIIIVHVYTPYDILSYMPLMWLTYDLICTPNALLLQCLVSITCVFWLYYVYMCVWTDCVGADNSLPSCSGAIPIHRVLWEETPNM